MNTVTIFQWYMPGARLAKEKRTRRSFMVMKAESKGTIAMTDAEQEQQKELEGDIVRVLQGAVQSELAAEMMAAGIAQEHEFGEGRLPLAKACLECAADYYAMFVMCRLGNTENGDEMTDDEKARVREETIQEALKDWRVLFDEAMSDLEVAMTELLVTLFVMADAEGDDAADNGNV